MWQSSTETRNPASTPSSHTPTSSELSNIPHLPPKASAQGTPLFEINDFTEARPRHSYRSEKFSGRIGSKVFRDDQCYFLMSTHVIIEAILARPNRDAIFGRN